MNGVYQIRYCEKSSGFARVAVVTASSPAAAEQSFQARRTESGQEPAQVRAIKFLAEAN